MYILDTLKYKVNCTISMFHARRLQEKTRKEILRYYAENHSSDPDIVEAVNYLKTHTLTVLPGSFTQNYIPEEIRINYNVVNGLHYVMHEGKRLYFRRSSTVEHIRLCYNGLLAEQDKHSPHCYLSKDFTVADGDVLLDVGCAEGILSLSNIEKAKKVCLFEIDKEWIEALEATFAPWKEKVIIVQKYVSDTNDELNITLDHFLESNNLSPDFVKIDVEGAEQRVLDGLKKSIQKKPLKIALCTYHRADDHTRFTHVLQEKGFSTGSSEGVMIFVNDLAHIAPPYFRKGVLRATNSPNTSNT
ncbi:MAG: FkbM family methyltransferase [Bacteroidales bacterium]|nr:FkbM family methyltransferase [Bacteroidales bacterium]MDD4822162.1 FkbM family methyltransferase [Bacteroidales bacterium]